MGFLKRNQQARTRIFFATDIHGSDRCFRKFLNAAKQYQASHVVIGGDLTGKVLVPIERRSSGYSADYGDKHYVDLSEEECGELKKLIRDRGSYYVVGTRDELLALADPATSEQAFRQAARERVIEWVSLADERLRGSGVRCFITPGNDDYPEIDDALRGSDVVEYVEGDVVALDDTYQMLTTGYANQTPWNSPRELPEAELGQRIDNLFSKADPAMRTLAVLHVPPYNSTLDQCPAIEVVNGEIRIKMGSGAPLMAGAGSTAVRAAIERYQPLLSLHGHIHESRAAERIGTTLCINPGSEYSNGVLSSVILSLSGDDVKYQFVNG